MGLESFTAVIAGLGISAVYYLIFRLTVDLAREATPTGVGALGFIGYFVRLIVVGGLLLGSLFWTDLNPLTTALSFLVSFTVVLIYTQGQALRSLLAYRAPERKE